MTLNTIALELVPPNVERGPEYALEEARKVVRISADSGLEGRIRHVMIPGMIAEDDDRPVPMKPKLDVLDFWSIIKPELPGVRGLCTQVTAFMDESSLRQAAHLPWGDAGFEGIVFVGVPPHDERRRKVRRRSHRRRVDIRLGWSGNRGVILIPTREGEQGRFNVQVQSGCQLRHDAAVVLRRDRWFPLRVRREPPIIGPKSCCPSASCRRSRPGWV